MALRTKQIEKSIRKGAKKVIVENGIDPSTHQGNKELKFLLKKLSNSPEITVTQAAKLGEDLGQKIVELSHKLGRQHLDRGVIRQLVLQGNLPSVNQLPSQEEPRVSHAKASQGKKPVQEVPLATTAKPKQQLQPAPQPKDVPVELPVPSKEATPKASETLQELGSADVSKTTPIAEPFNEDVPDQSELAIAALNKDEKSVAELDEEALARDGSMEVEIESETEVEAESEVEVELEEDPDEAELE
jgi:hypothetical protein